MAKQELGKLSQWREKGLRILQPHGKMIPFVVLFPELFIKFLKISKSRFVGKRNWGNHLINIFLRLKCSSEKKKILPVCERRVNDYVCKNTTKQSTNHLFSPGKSKTIAFYT